MDQYFVSKWAVERHMRQQFEPLPDPEAQDDDQPTRPRTFIVRRRLGRLLYRLAAIIEPSPSIQKPHMS